MADDVALLQKLGQALSRAYNSRQAAEFLKYFAARLQPTLDQDQRKMRLTVLRMTGALVDTEFQEAMDDLTSIWSEFRVSQHK